MDSEQKKKCSELVEYFFKLDSTGAAVGPSTMGSVCEKPFRERVNWEEWGLYDYLQVVKIPMDLGTIRNKLSKNEYKKPVEFARDVRLVWDNCKLYNQDGSELYDIADGLSKKFEDRVKAMKLDVGAAPRADKSVPAPSINEKLHFSQNIYKVSTKDLGAIVAILEEKCPKALDKVRILFACCFVAWRFVHITKLSNVQLLLFFLPQSSTDELDIVIDSIDNKTFRELESFVMERVPEGSREPVATPKSSKKSSSSKRSSKEPSSSSASKKIKTSE